MLVPILGLRLSVSIQEVVGHVFVTALTQGVQSRPADVDAVNLHYKQFIPLPLSHDDNLRTYTPVENQCVNAEITTGLHHS